MATVEMWNSENFDAAATAGVVLADFWATWCGPCKMMLPVLEKVAAELGDDVRVGKINVDEDKALAVRFQIRNLPTFLVLKDGVVKTALSGVQSKDKLIAAVRAAL